MRTTLRVAGRALAIVVGVLAAAALVLGVLVPRLAGATPYVVSTGSMRPALPVGSLVVARPVDPAAIRTGTVITYQLRPGEPTLVTHRVVSVGTTVGGVAAFTTQGDANEVPDPVPVRAEQVKGALWYQVPLLGYVASLASGQQRALVGTVVALLLLVYAGWNVAAAVRERRGRRLRRGAHAAPAHAAGTDK